MKQKWRCSKVFYNNNNREERGGGWSLNGIRAAISDSLDEVKQTRKNRKSKWRYQKKAKSFSPFHRSSVRPSVHSGEWAVALI